MLMGVMGLLFQLPVADPRRHAHGDREHAPAARATARYAILIIAVVAAVLPGTDPVTMLSMMLPMVLLYEVSILLAALLDRRAARAQDAAGDDGEPDLPALDNGDD